MRDYSPSCRFVSCLLLLSGVLVMGIVQWSFLPFLIQSGPSASTIVLEFSASRMSKFAAPFKCLIGDGMNPCLAQSNFTVRRITSGIVRLPDTPISGRDDFSLTHRPLRAPPSV
jgi:hypothetical protein